MTTNSYFGKWVESKGGTSLVPYQVLETWLVGFNVHGAPTYSGPVWDRGPSELRDLGGKHRDFRGTVGMDFFDMLDAVRAGTYVVDEWEPPEFTRWRKLLRANARLPRLVVGE